MKAALTLASPYHYARGLNPPPHQHWIEAGARQLAKAVLVTSPPDGLQILIQTPVKLCRWLGALGEIRRNNRRTTWHQESPQNWHLTIAEALETCNQVAKVQL